MSSQPDASRLTVPLWSLGIGSRFLHNGNRWTCTGHGHYKPTEQEGQRSFDEYPAPGRLIVEVPEGSLEAKRSKRAQKLNVVELSAQDLRRSRRHLAEFADRNGLHHPDDKPRQLTEAASLIGELLEQEADVAADLKDEVERLDREIQEREPWSPREED